MGLLDVKNMMTEINISVTWLENKVEEHIPNSKTKKAEKENGRPNIGNLENQYKKSKHLIGRCFREREQRAQWGESCKNIIKGNFKERKRMNSQFDSTIKINKEMF